MEAFRTEGSFVHSPLFNLSVLRDLFQANVLTLLLKERMISPELVERMKDWLVSSNRHRTAAEPRWEGLRGLFPCSVLDFAERSALSLPM